ncbi:purine-cytosine permease [Usnea florida]
MDDKSRYEVGSYSPNGTDPEKGSPVYNPEAPAVSGDIFITGDSLYAKIQRSVSKFGVEPRGIERVPEDERTDTNLMKAGTMWFSANMVVSSFAIGALAIPVFDLGFVDALLTIFFINCLAITPVAFFSTFGPRFGLRQMVLSRYFFGFHGVKVIAVFNVLACVGWSAVNVIVGAQLINAVNANVPGYAGIIIIAAATWLVTVFGYKVVHVYEFYSWIPSLIIFLIVLGEFAHSGRFSNLPMGSGSTEAGSILSFAASVFGFGTGWTSYAADYTVYQPVTASRIKTFFWTWGGLITALCFTEMLGLAVATATLDPVDTSYADGYSQSGIGGLLAAVLFPPLGRFGQFCLVILALSIVANNCPNIYSVTFSLQVMGRWTQAVPRFIWTFVGTLVYCAIAIPGYSHFESAYWLAIYEGISLTEHFIFKRRRYDISIWNNPNLLPPGIAAILAFLFGVFGAVMGMSQPWFIGPIGKRIGDPSYGGDIGFELAFAFAALSFGLFRWVEKGRFGR